MRSRPAASTCSQLSTTSSTSLSASASISRAATRAPGASGSPNARATWPSTRPGSCTGARSTKTTPSAKRGAASAATASARRVLPTPGGPVRVSSRASGSESVARSGASSACRPIRGSAGRGRRQRLRQVGAIALQTVKRIICPNIDRVNSVAGRIVSRGVQSACTRAGPVGLRRTRRGAGRRTRCSACAGPAIIFLPSWQILHSRQWKLQVPVSRPALPGDHLSTARGNGPSDRPGEAERYADREIVADAVAVLDAVGVERGGVRGHVDGRASTGCSRGVVPGAGRAASWRSARRALALPRSTGGEPVLRVGCGGQRRRFCADAACRTTARSSSTSWGRRSPSRTDEAGRGRGRLGPGDRRRRRSRSPSPPGRASTKAAFEDGVPGGALPGAGGARRRGRDHPVRARCGAGRADRRRARHARGRRAPAVARRPGAVATC